MPHVVFSNHLKTHVDSPERVVVGSDVRAALEAVFREEPRLRGYVLDDQGQLRQHVLLFVDGELVGDRRELSDVLRPESEVYVTQALSGG